MQPKFDYDDVVTVRKEANPSVRPGEKGWVVGVFEERPLGVYFEKFPPGVVYSVEFEDGNSIEIHESGLLEASAGESS